MAGVSPNVATNFVSHFWRANLACIRDRGNLMDQTIFREEQIFMNAVEIADSIERQRYVAETCGADIELQQKLKRMLELHSRTDNLLDGSSDGLFDDKDADKQEIVAGMVVGPYKLLQQIGAGGMGVVFMAQQTEPVRRTVAIKIVQRGGSQRNVIARFESERQALAMMDHPNIAKFLDAGMTNRGQPYFVMELITGLPINQYSDNRKLTLRQRLKLFSSVCKAIQHAHQKGVIHRDIKPSNIMVTEFDGEAVPKIIDFGIAKAVNQPLTEKTLFTSYGNIVGTPEYMSPEQAEMNGLDVDTCSDVYSLGVVLYELMTGTTPLIDYKQKGLLKFCDAICNVEPALASTCANSLIDSTKETAANRGVDGRSLRQFLKGDVDWILAKCLAKSREDRYATAAELAADIDRCLCGAPVLAAAPSKSYRVKKFLSRHRFPAAIGTVLVVSLLGATIVSLIFAIRARDAQQLASQHLSDSRESQRIAEAERDRALAAEAKVREMERASRLEASSAQAVVRFRNQEKNANAVQADDDPLGQSKVEKLQIEVAPNGSITMKGVDGEFTLDFAVRSRVSPLPTATRRRIQTLEPADHERAKQVLNLVTEEMRRRFGSLDLYVAEPKMMLAELAMQEDDWATAAKHVRANGRLFVNNFSRRDLKMKNQLLLALILANKDPNSTEVVKLLRRIHEYLCDLPDLDLELRSTLAEIGESLERESNGEAGGGLDRGILKLVELDEVVLSSVFESMEVELQRRARTVQFP